MATSPSSPGCAALLIIDLQFGMFNGDRMAPIHAGDVLLTHTQSVLSCARRSGTRVIYVRHGGRAGDPLECGTPNWHIQSSIAPQSGEAIVDKRTPDSFHETSLLDDLNSAGVNRLFVMGAQTELCVDTTCRRAFTLGFDVTLVSDGHSTWDNKTLTADQIIQHTNQTLAGWFVRLVPASDVGMFVP